MYIRPTQNAKEGNFGDILEKYGFESLYYDLLLYRNNEDVATPWDADITIKEGNVILDGSMVPGSAPTPRAAGHCVCTCSISKFNELFQIEVPNLLDEGDDGDDGRFEAYTGWEIYR